MKTQDYVGIDLGAESGRVMIGQFDGERVSLREMHRFPTGGVNIAGTLRWDVLHFWREIQEGLAKVAASDTNITSVGVDTWGVDYVLLGENDELLGLPWHYRDSRTQGMLAEVTGRISRADIFRQTGIQFMEFNTLYQLAAARRSGRLLDSARRFLTIPDFFHWCLCGSTAVEFTNATTTQCFDPTARGWAKPLLESLELPREIFPDTVEPGTSLENLRGSVCTLTGLPPIHVVAPATHDTGSAVAAVPVSRDHGGNWAYISSGTWSLVGLEMDKPVLTEAAREQNVTNEGGVDGTWRLLKNVMGLWLVQRLKASLDRSGKPRTYEELCRDAASATPFQVWIDPDDPSFLNPDDMRQAITDFCRETGQSPPADEGSAVRCVLESLALKYCRVLRSLEQLSKRTVEVIHVVGGGSRNALLNQFIANTCKLPVVAGPVEATVMGNILVQCRAAGELESLAHIREVVRRSSELEQFDPEDDPQWADARNRFDSICHLHD